MYKCLNCGSEVEASQIKDKVRCPYCGYRIVAKERSKTITKVPAK